MNEEKIKSIIALQRINNQLLGIIDRLKNQKASNSITLMEILDQLYEPYDKIEPNYRDEHIFFNQYQLISSLYVYIVLPKEIFFDSIDDNLETKSLNNRWGINGLSPSYKLKYFLRRLRNAISHGRIEFTQTMDFTFTDQNPKNRSDIFSVTLSAEQLQMFCQALAYWCITKDVELKELKT